MRGGTLFTISHHMNPLPGKRIYVSDNFHVQVSKIYETCKWNVSVYRLNKKSNENKRYLYTFEIRILCSLFYRKRVCVCVCGISKNMLSINGFKWYNSVHHPIHTWIFLFLFNKKSPFQSFLWITGNFNLSLSFCCQLTCTLTHTNVFSSIHHQSIVLFSSSFVKNIWMNECIQSILLARKVNMNSIYHTTP